MARTLSMCLLTRRRLAHNWGGTLFDYTPVPPLVYTELQVSSDLEHRKLHGTEGTF